MKRRDLIRAGAVAGFGLGSGSLVGRSGADSALSETGRADHNRAESYDPLAVLELEAAFEAVVGHDGQVVYVATGDGFVSVDVSNPTDPSILARETGVLPDWADGPLQLAWDLCVDGNELILVGPAHGRQGAVNAVARFDISDPAAPAFVGGVETDTSIHNAHLADGYAYLTGNDGDRNPLVVIDLATGSETARWSVHDHDARWGEVSPELYSVHDVHVSDGIAYVSYWDAGVHLLDVSEPTAVTHLSAIGGADPAELAALDASELDQRRTTPPGNAHYAAPNEDGDLLAVNHEAWAVADGETLLGGPGGIDLYDISDAQTPEHRATIQPPESPDPTYGGVWTTSHNFELRDGRLYSSWYDGGVRLYDVSSPTSPRQLAAWRDPDAASFWTAQAGITDEFFIASSTDYRAESALYLFPDRATTSSDGRPAAHDDSHSSSETDESGADETPALDDATTDSTPGFGAGIGLATVGGAAWWLRRRVGDGES